MGEGSSSPLICSAFSMEPVTAAAARQLQIRTDEAANEYEYKLYEVSTHQTEIRVDERR